MPTALIIRPDGNVDHRDGPFDNTHAPTAVDAPTVDVFSLGIDRGLVGAVDEWANRKGLPTNTAAWVCYGRSPLRGSVAVWRNDGQALTEAQVTLIEGVAEAFRTGGFDAAVNYAAEHSPEVSR